MQRRRRTVLDKKVLLDAFASIFVRDHEVVAAAAASQPVSVLSTEGEIRVWQLLAIQDDDRYAESHGEANWERKGKPLLGLEDVQQLPQGRSYFKDISRKNWSWIHKVM